MNQPSLLQTLLQHRAALISSQLLFQLGALRAFFAFRDDDLNFLLGVYGNAAIIFVGWFGGLLANRRLKWGIAGTAALYAGTGAVGWLVWR